MSKKAEAKKKPIISKHELPARRVMIYKDGNDSQLPIIAKLRHPQSNEGALFLFTDNYTTVQEVIRCSDTKRSYLIDNTVSSDGDLYVGTPIDPLFLALPYLYKVNRCSPLEQMIMDDDFPETEHILTCTGMKYLNQIADQRGDESLNAFIYNEEKTLKWLEKKVNRLAAALKEQNLHVSVSASTSANFVKTEKNQDSDESYTRYALGMVSDYLPDSLAQKLSVHLNLPEEELSSSNKRKEIDDDHKSNKKAKMNNDDEIENSPPFVNKQEKKEEKKPSAKTQAMAKAAKGTKSIASFFKKK